MWVPTYEFLRELLNGDTLHGHDSTAILANSSVGLLRGPFTPSASSSIGQAGWLEANYDGYARKAIGAFTLAFTGENNKVLATGAVGLFQPTGDSTVNSVYGQFITGSDSAKLLAVEMFDQPIALPDSSHGLVITILIGLDPSANYGSSIVSTT